MDLGTFYQLWPGKNCGICGYGSCNTFARHVVFRGDDPAQCLWLTGEEVFHIKDVLCNVRPVKTRVKKSAVFEPCITDSEMVMAEIYLAPQKVDYGFLDPGFCDVLPLYFTSVKCSKKLGIARIEHEEKEILLSQSGKLIVRQAKTEEDALEACNVLSRLVSGSVICSCLATGIECVSGLCSCRKCEILQKVGTLTLQKNSAALIREYKDAVVTALSHVWKRSLPELPDDVPLKAEAVTLLSENSAGLIFYSLVHHLSSIKEALKGAVTHKVENEYQKAIDRVVTHALAGSYRLEEYKKLCTSCRERMENPLFKELYSVLFHARCTAEIVRAFHIHV